MYAKLREEVANNPQEKLALEMIAKGVDLHESREKSGLSKEAFYNLLDRAEQWEVENLCGNRDSQEKT